MRLITRLSLPLALSAALANADEFDGRTILEGRHFQANYDQTGDVWEIGLNTGHDASGQLHAADTIILLIDSEAREEVPSDLPEEMSFLGEEGDDVWLSQDFGLQYGIGEDVFVDDRVEMTLVGFDGPGHSFTYDFPGGELVLFYDTRPEGPPFGTMDQVSAGGGHGHFNWAFRDRGVYFFTLQASGTREGDGAETSSDPVTFTVMVDPLPIHWWLLQNFGEVANHPVAGLANDPDGDRVPNLLEYAFDLDPLSPGREGLPRIETVTEGEQQYPGISFRRPAGREDVHYQVEVSNDLQAGWEPLDEEDSDTEWSEDNDGTPLLSVRDTNPPEDDRRFFRVGVTLVGDDG